MQYVFRICVLYYIGRIDLINVWTVFAYICTCTVNQISRFFFIIISIFFAVCHFSPLFKKRTMLFYMKQDTAVTSHISIPSKKPFSYSRLHVFLLLFSHTKGWRDTYTVVGSIVSTQLITDSIHSPVYRLKIQNTLKSQSIQLQTQKPTLTSFLQK